MIKYDPESRKAFGDEAPEDDMEPGHLNFEEPYECGHQRWPGLYHCPCVDEISEEEEGARNDDEYYAKCAKK